MARAGDVVGSKYRLIHPLGIGGMGTVWRAEHLALKQQVAIKLLDVKGPQAERAIKRFHREAQIAASVRHRNIVYISDFGIDDGAPYLVMELLSGVPLSERMVVGEPLGVTTFLRLVEETLQGLSAVHAAGVVHRDMKPENVFLVRDADGTVFPKLLDFGVSRSTERGQGHTITREGVVMGTPEYVSPEQARGKMADVRSDIYSIGVVVYEALAGRLPFQADNPADLIVAVLNTRPPTLSTFRPELGEALSELVAKAIAREPEQRFQSADEMRHAISSLLASDGSLEAHALPKRFLAPSSQLSPNDEDGEEGTRRSSAPTLEGPKTTPMLPHSETQLVRLPHNRTLHWLAFGSVLAAAAAMLLMFSGGSSAGARGVATAAEPLLESAPGVLEGKPNAPPAEVAVELFGVPSDATVWADGVVQSGNTLRFSRNSGAHEIVVEAKGRESFRVMHDAARDGRYAISLDLLDNKPKPQRATPAPSKSGAKVRGGLLRRPDF
jgi:serine/threonine protein kinase